jgi:hypothetical protein
LHDNLRIGVSCPLHFNIKTAGKKAGPFSGQQFGLCRIVLHQLKPNLAQTCARQRDKPIGPVIVFSQPRFPDLGAPAMIIFPVGAGKEAAQH